MDFGQYIKQYTPESEVLEQWLHDFVKKEMLPKGTLLLKPHNSSQKVFFIEEGLARTFYLKDGKDITHYFFKENEVSAPIDSIFFGKTSQYGLELLENSTISSFNYDRLEALKLEFPVLERMQNRILINVLSSFSDKLYGIQFQTAKDRYDIMMKQYPDILLRASLGHIASYLGITQQTLSVIRSQV